MSTVRLSDKPIYSTFAEGDPNTSPEEAARMQSAVDMQNRWRSFRERAGMNNSGAGAAFNPNSLGQAIVGGNDAMMGGMDGVQNKSVTMAGNGEIDGLPGSRNSGGYGGGYNNQMSQGLTNLGLGGSAVAGKNANYWQDQASQTRGPQAYENQDLSNRESASRYGDQNGALMLQREAAMGNAPSAAAYQMQRGLDQSLGAQQAQMGAARGNAGIALASSGAAANSANLMNQTYNQAGQLRAQEMSNARGQYGELASQQRGQDLNRLGMGNDMANRNADRNDAYRLGAGGLANQFGNQGLGWYNGSTSANDADGRLALGYAQLNSGIAQGNADRKLKADTFNAGQDTAMLNQGLQAGGMLLNTAANVYTAGGYGAATAAASAASNASNGGIGGSLRTPAGPAPSPNGTTGMNYGGSNADPYGQAGYGYRPSGGVGAW